MEVSKPDDGEVMVGQIEFTVFEGPSLVAPFAAVVAEFEAPFDQTLPPREIFRLLNKLIPFASNLTVKLPEEGVDFVALVVALTDAVQEFFFLTALPSRILRLDDRRCRVAIGFHESGSTRGILSIGIEIANAIFSNASGAARNVHNVSNRLLNLAKPRGRRISKIAAAFSRLARARGIPTYAISRDAGIIAYGQGSKGFHFREMENNRDSHTGWVLSGNKAYTRQLLEELGFPTALHEIATDSSDAVKAAQNIGYPVVVKPPDRGAGTAVTVGVTTEEELAAAFLRAKQASRSKHVLVERYIAGDDHRLSVFGGKLMRVTRLLPPRIMGDGKRTVEELIEAEIRSPSDSGAAKAFTRQLTIDPEMKALLAKQGYTLDDRPQQGIELRLRNTSNLHTGGTREDVTAKIHSDNVAMAEAIAKNFRLDAIGIDFITPDIGRPWYETNCAIIEVNYNPGVIDERIMEKILLEKFPAGSDGRIPSILIVGGEAQLVDGIVQCLEACGQCVGQTTDAGTMLAGQPRFCGGADLPARILGLLLDSTCEALVVSCTPNHIVDFGLPHTCYDLVIVGASNVLNDDLRRLVKANSSQMIDGVTADMLDKTVRPLIEEIVGKS